MWQQIALACMQVYLQPEQKDSINAKALDVTFGDDLDYDDLTLDVADAPEGAFASEEDAFYRRVRGVRCLVLLFASLFPDSWRLNSCFAGGEGSGGFLNFMFVGIV